MSPDEYSFLCDKILTETMQYIKTDHMKKSIIQPFPVSSINPVYISAAANSSPITIVYTPVGSGKSALITDRVNLLIQNNIPADNIAVLSMNIAKTKQTQIELPGVRCMTFSDFTHALFMANYTGYDLSDEKSIMNTLLLSEQTPFRQAFLNKLSVKNPQDKNSLLTIFVNNHLAEIEAELAAIHKTDYNLESMICQNRIYQFLNNPFPLQEILVNGVHNMPLHTLCCLLSYAYKYNCRLFFTGMPDETIYEFNMAYGKAMNILSGYSNTLAISIVRLPCIKMEPDIENTMLQKNGISVHSSRVQTAHINTKYTNPDQAVRQTLTTDTDYIQERLSNKEQILFLAKSKSDIHEMKSIITDYYISKYPALSVTDLTEIQAPFSLWGEILVKNCASLKTMYPYGINKIELYQKLWLLLSSKITTASSPYMKEIYEQNRYELEKRANSIWTQDNRQIKPVITRIQEIIDEESAQIQNHMLYMKNHIAMDLSKTDMIFSTIHSAIDIRCNHAVVYFKNSSDHVDENLYRIALSRANKTEYLIFANTDNFDVPVQQYLKHHLV